MTDEAAPDAGHPVAEAGEAPGAPRPRRLTPPIIALIVAGGVLLLAVAGTGIALAVGGGGPSPAPVAAETPGATPSSSATPEPEVVEPPQPILNAACEDLISDVTIRTLFPADPDVSVRETPDAAPASSWSADYRQAGHTVCRWSNESRPEGDFVDGVELHIVPDGSEAGRTAIDAGYGIDAAYTDYDTSGDRSASQCGVWDQYYCVAEMLVGGYWVHTYLSNSSVVGATEDQAQAAIARVLSEVEAGIRNAGPDRSPWSGPTDPYDGESLCELSTEAASEASGISLKKKWDSGDLDGEYPSPGTVASQRVGVVRCTWEGSKGAYLAIRTVPGGAWAVPALIDSGDSEGMSGSEATVDGADAALVGCEDSWCFGVVAYEGSRIRVDAGYKDFADREEVIAAVERLLATIPKSAP